MVGLFFFFFLIKGGPLHMVMTRYAAAVLQTVAQGKDEIQLLEVSLDEAAGHDFIHVCPCLTDFTTPYQSC